MDTKRGESNFEKKRQNRMKKIDLKTRCPFCCMACTIRVIFVIVNIKGVPGFKFLNAKLFVWRIDKIDVS